MGRPEIIVGALGSHGARFFTAESRTLKPIRLKTAAKDGSNKGHDILNHQYSYAFVGCHLRRKVVELAKNDEAVKRRVVGSSPA